MSDDTLYLIHLKQVPIYEQLLLEEALLRVDNRNWCLLNEGSMPAIVMGISSRPEHLIDIPRAQQHNIPIIRRFSGGGTVIVDEQTLFATWIINQKSIQIPPYPESVMRWTAEIYSSFLSPIGFHLKELDYAIGNQKCGGNAQYFKKDRWLHHTTFLWNWQPQLMELLLNPEKAPSYRQRRSHIEFLCKLKDYLPTPKSFFDGVTAQCERIFKQVHVVDFKEAERCLDKPYRQATNYFWESHKRKGLAKGSLISHCQPKYIGGTAS